MVVVYQLAGHRQSAAVLEMVETFKWQGILQYDKTNLTISILHVIVIVQYQVKCTALHARTTKIAHRIVCGNRKVVFSHKHITSCWNNG